jgi:hypothetical protein
METSQEKVDAKIDANEEKTEARIDAINGILRSFQVLLSPGGISTKPGQSPLKKKMKAKMDIYQEKMEAAIHSIRSELEETIRYQVEDDLACVDQKTQGLCKELTEIHETQVGL